MDKLERIEQIEKELAELKEQVKAEEPKGWPQPGDLYYWIDLYGSVYTDLWAGDKRSAIDIARLEMGNVYQYEAEAEEAVRKRKAEVAYKRKVAEVNGNWKPNWKDATAKKQYLYYDHSEGRIDVYHMLFHQFLDNSEYFRPDVSGEQLAELKRLYPDVSDEQLAELKWLYAGWRGLNNG